MTPGTAAASRPALSRSAKLVTRPLSVTRPAAVVTSMAVASTDVSATSLERTAAVTSASPLDRVCASGPAAVLVLVSVARSVAVSAWPAPWPSPISMAVQPVRPRQTNRSGSRRVAERPAFMGISGTGPPHCGAAGQRFHDAPLLLRAERGPGADLVEGAQTARADVPFVQRADVHAGRGRASRRRLVHHCLVQSWRLPVTMHL